MLAVAVPAMVAVTPIPGIALHEAEKETLPTDTPLYNVFAGWGKP
jgi:hypothetical protein